MAEAITNARSGGTLQAYSAGVEPLDRVPPMVLEVLEKHNISTAGLTPKTWQQFAGFGAPKLNFVITTCDTIASDVCPSWPGQPLSARWTIPDPAGKAASQHDIKENLEAIYHLTTRLVDMFLCLPTEAQDRMTLETELHKIA